MVCVLTLLVFEAEHYDETQCVEQCDAHAGKEVEAPRASGQLHELRCNERCCCRADPVHRVQDPHLGRGVVLEGCDVPVCLRILCSNKNNTNR